jgi:hypothetical protein
MNIEAKLIDAALHKKERIALSHSSNYRIQWLDSKIIVQQAQNNVFNVINNAT